MLFRSKKVLREMRCSILQVQATWTKEALSMCDKIS